MVSDQVRHKPGCTATEAGYRLEVLDLESTGVVLSSENKGADQLRNYCEADQRLCFRYPSPLFSHMQNVGFLMTWLIFLYRIMTPISKKEYIHMTHRQIYGPNHEKTRFYDFARTKVQISCADLHS